MTESNKPAIPTLSKERSLREILMGILTFILWIILILTSIHIFACYIYCIIKSCLFDSETMKYAVMLVIGSYLLLVVDKNKILDALGLNIKNNGSLAKWLF